MQYTAREYSILTGSFPEDAELLRHTMPDGRILVAAAKKWHADDYTTVSRRANMIYWVLLPVSLLLITFFILFLNKRVKNPLIQLSAAINRMAAGGAADAHVGMVNGPYEMQAIARNFDCMADQLAESEAERRRLDADKQKLLTDISHDLKTPITVIDDKAEELNDLLNSFYEYNKVNHPEFRVQPVVADVCEFLREYLAKRYDEINLAGFALRISIPEKMILCAIDQPMMTRALNNIIYNAMQYNALGTVMGIKIVETEERNKPNTIAIRLEDNGVGIAPERRARIFEPFVTGAKAAVWDVPLPKKSSKLMAVRLHFWTSQVRDSVRNLRFCSRRSCDFLQATDEQKYRKRTFSKEKIRKSKEFRKKDAIK